MADMLIDSPIGVVQFGSVIKGIRNIPCCIMRNPGGPNPLSSLTVAKWERKSIQQTGGKTYS